MRNNNKVPLGVANALLDEAEWTLRHVFTAYLFRQFPQGVKDLCQALEYIFKAFYCISFNDNEYKKLGHDITKIIPVGRREIDAYFKNKTDEKNEITHRVSSHISSSDKQLSDAISHTSRFSNLLNMDFDSLIECYKNEATKNGDFNEKQSLFRIFFFYR